jgi:hypothetical protein
MCIMMEWDICMQGMYGNKYACMYKDKIQANIMCMQATISTGAYQVHACMYICQQEVRCSSSSDSSQV